MSRIASSPVERKLILLSAGVAARRQEMRERVRAGPIAEVNWTQLAEMLRRRRLLPTLGPRVLELAGDRASIDFAAAVEQAVSATRRHTTYLQLVSTHVMTALNEAGIRCAALKGPLLGEAIYGDPGRRISSDIDLLVAPQQLHAAVDVVRGLHYQAPTDHVDRWGLPQLHFQLVHERQEMPSVELHWRVHCYERDFAHDRLLPPTGHAPGRWRPAPADELVALLLFYARDGFIGLRLASDISAWWDKRGTELQAGALEDLVRLYPALARSVRVAVKFAERVVGLPATQVFSETPRLGVRDRIAVRLANPFPRASEAQLYADAGLVDGLLTPSGGFGAFLRRQVVPPREVLDELDRSAPKRRARSTLWRGAGILGRYALTLARLPAGRYRLRW